MRRRSLVLALRAVVLAVPPAADAQPPARVARIGFLGRAVSNPQFEALRRGLRDLGWIEGGNLVMRLALLKEAIPGLAAVAVLVNADDPRARSMLVATEGTARSVGVHLQVVEVRGAADLDSAVTAAARGKAEALALLGSSFYFSRIPELAAKALDLTVSPSVLARADVVVR